jgi:hypothetical protein
MMGKHFYAGRMVEFSMLYKTNMDFTDVMRFDILLQSPGERPTNNFIAVIFKKFSDGLEIFTMCERDCRIFSRKMARQRQRLQPEITVLGDWRLTGGNKIGKLRCRRHGFFKGQITEDRGQISETRSQRTEIKK